MRKSITFLLTAVLIVSMFVTPGQIASAQGIDLRATINKTFTPINIPAGGTSVLRLFIFNPNNFELTNAALTDNMPTGIRVMSVTGNSCGGNVSAPAGSSTIALTNGTVPRQTGSTPGVCTVTVNVTAPSAGTFHNIIRAGDLSSNGPGGVSVTNLSDVDVSLQVNPAAEPSVNKNFNPTSIWAGGTSTLEINIVNSSNTALTGASITDDLPTNIFFATGATPTLTATCGGSASATLSGTRLTLNNGNIPVGATCTITVDVTGDVQGAYTNRIPAGTLQNNENLTNAADATARLTVREIGVTKRFANATISVGGTTTLTITLQNPKAADYQGVSVTDNLPSALNVNGPVTSTCGVPPGSITATANSVTLNNGTIPGGSPVSPGTCTITVPVIAVAGTQSGPYTNTIPRGSLTTSVGIGNLTAANASITVAGTDVSGSKSFTPASILAGENSRLSINIIAPGDTNLTNFFITDNLPAGVTISNVNTSGVTTPATKNAACIGGTLTADTGASTITWTGGTINAGQLCTIDVWVTGSIPGTYTNTIPPTNIRNDQNRVPTNALTRDLGITATGTLAIRLNKGFDPPQVFGGAASTMSLILTNLSGLTLTGIEFGDVMPTGMVLANPVNSNVGTCGGAINANPGDSSFTFSGGTLPPFGSCTLTLSATISINGNLINTIPDNAVRTNEGVTNPDPVGATLSNLPGASVNKSFSPNPIPSGSYSLLTIIVQNTGNIGLTAMGVSDSLPAGLEIAGGSAPAPVNNCGGTFTAVAGTQLIELVNGVLAGNSSCTMVVAVTGSSPGDYLNTIPVGGMHADPNTQNTSPASATLTISGTTVDNTVAGPGGGGRRRNSQTGTAATGQALIPVTAGFAPGMVTKLDVSASKAYDATGLNIEIPVIKVNTPIVGVESNKGNWDISWLRDEVGWLNGTAYPTWKGNSVLTAHVVNADGKPGVFYNLKSLGLGEYIFVNSAGYRYTYKVLSNTFIQPTDKAVMKHEEKSHLTLITCDTYDEATGKYKRYVMVRAELVDVRSIK